MKSIVLSISGLLLAASVGFAETPKAAYKKIGDLLRAGHADKVAVLMTKKAHQEMVDSSIEDAAEGYLFHKDAAKLLPDGTKALGTDIGFDKFKFPKWFATKGGFPDAGSNMAGFRKNLRALMDNVPDRKRALNSLHAFAMAAYPGGTFDGKIIEPPKGHEDTPRILWVEYDEGYQVFTYPLKFEKQKNGSLLYAGYDWDLIRAEENKFIQHENLTITGLTLEDKKISLKDFRGKVVLVDFWGTWCGPCIAGFPHLKTIKEAYAPHGFEILGVAQDKKKDLSAFFKKNGPLAWPSIRDPKSEIADRLKVKAFPTYMLVDKNGKHISTPRDKEELGGLIAELLGIDPIPLKKVDEKEDENDAK